jgi:dGTPase
VSAATAGGRTARRHPEPARITTADSADQREAFEIDRDRILYCSAFRRLAGVTQVVHVAEGHVFHNRLTHSMKAAQVARRLAQRLTKEWPTEASSLGIEPEVVEAAALAHDLGHPPFGHIAEQTLHALVCASDPGSCDGYEGNAQTFRILTRLACRRPEYSGLNLTRSTLQAVMKYPWYYDPASERKSRKWNSYRSEELDFEFVLASQAEPRAKSPEAQIMEWADDIAYSVHDVEDFYRAGVLPLDRLVKDVDEREHFVAAAAKWAGVSAGDASQAMSILGGYAPGELMKKYSGGLTQRGQLRQFTSLLIGRYVKAVKIEGEPARLVMPSEHATEIAVLKQLMRFYVFETPELAIQQHGQKKVIRDLFSIFLEATRRENHTSRRVLPVAIREFLEQEEQRSHNVPQLQVRVAADAVAGLTEQQALVLHRRLTGLESGTIRDLVML